MHFTGTLVNIIAVFLGGMIGIFFGARLPERIRNTITSGLGLFTAMIGIQMFFKTEESLIVLGSLLMGGLLGEWWRIEDRLKTFGGWLERKFIPQKKPVSSVDPSVGQSQNNNRFIQGFLTASLLFCVGPVAILGSIQDGLSGDYHLLVIKSIMDGFASIAFASSLGVGVMFSTITVFIYQGGITLLATQLQEIVTDPMMNEMTAVGGVLLLGIAISSLLEIKPIRVGNFLPALIIAPLLVALLK